MKKYELLFIVDASIADEEKEKVVSAVSEIISKAGGKPGEPDKWGVRKYAYPVNYKTEGYYVCMTFCGEGALVQEVKRVVGITEHVLRRLITKVA